MENLAVKLKSTVQAVSDQLQDLSEELVSIKPTPDKWSKKEILGHLIDSAANNHQRFMNAQFQNNLVFNGYAQDQWVDYQDYQNADWNELVSLFVSYNLHICRVIDNIPAGVLRRRLTDHNFHLIAFKTVPKGEPTSLGYFVDDYIGHIDHHLRQILG